MSADIVTEPYEFQVYETPIRYWGDITATPVTDEDVEITRAELEGGVCDFIKMLKLDDKAVVLATQLRLFDFGKATKVGSETELNSVNETVEWYGFEAYSLRYNMIASEAARNALKGSGF